MNPVGIIVTATVKRLVRFTKKYRYICSVHTGYFCNNKLIKFLETKSIIFYNSHSIQSLFVRIFPYPSV